MKTSKSFWRVTALTAAGALFATTGFAENTPAREGERGGATQNEAVGSHHATGTPRTMADEGLSLDTPARPDRATSMTASTQPTAADVRALQQALREQLLYDGEIDGIAGPQTRAALREFQSREQLPVTGTISQQTRLALGLEPAQSTEQSARAQRQQLSGQERPEQGAIQRVAGSEEIFGIGQLSEEHTREIQRQLQARGLYTGEVDGKFGPLTRNAVMGFFRAQARDVAAGRLSAEALEFFNLDPSAVQPARQSEQQQGSTRQAPSNRSVPGAEGTTGAESGLPDQPTRRDAPDVAPDPQNPDPQSLPGTPDEEFEPAELPPEGYER